MVAINSVDAALSIARLEASRPRANAKSERGAGSVVPQIKAAASSGGSTARVFDALNTIGKFTGQFDMIKSGNGAMLSADAAIAIVKSWVLAGLFKDSANGKEDASLKQAAADKHMPDLPALTAMEAKQLSTGELRVYRDMRYWHTYYEYKPYFDPPGIGSSIKTYLNDA